jgi:hypothetical protein
MRTVWAAALLALLPACTTPLDASGQRCGGNAINSPKCPSGYTCVSTVDGGPPVGDVGGVCQKGDLVSNPPTDGAGGASGADGSATRNFGYQGLGGHPAEAACPTGLAYGNTICGVYPDNTLCIMGCIVVDGGATYAPPSGSCYADQLAVGSSSMLASHAVICLAVSTPGCDCPGFGTTGTGGGSGADPGIDAGTDAGTTGCENCGAGMTCAYPIADECSAVGTCVKVPAPNPCNAVSLLTGCGCDGRAVMWHGACQPDLPEGYAPMPIVHTGSCP